MIAIIFYFLTGCMVPFLALTLWFGLVGLVQHYRIKEIRLKGHYK